MTKLEYFNKAKEIIADIQAFSRLSIALGYHEIPNDKQLGAISDTLYSRRDLNELENDLPNLDSRLETYPIDEVNKLAYRDFVIACHRSGSVNTKY